MNVSPLISLAFRVESLKIAAFTIRRDHGVIDAAIRMTIKVSIAQAAGSALRSSRIGPSSALEISRTYS